MNHAFSRRRQAFVCLFLAPHVFALDSARAQDDPAARDDASEYLHDQLVDEEETAVRPAPSSKWSGQFGLTGLYTTNAAQRRDNPRASLYAIPDLSVTYTANPDAAWRVSLSGDVSGEYFSRDGASLNETRVTGTARVSRNLPAGRLSIALRSRTVFSGLFDKEDYARWGPLISFRPAGTGALRLRLDAEYRFSDAESQRRFLLLGRADGSIFKDRTVGELRLSQELRLSRFRAGSNAGRRDLRSATTLSYEPSIELGEAVGVSFAATLFHNFSNRPNRRFTDLEIGPTVSVTF